WSLHKWIRRGSPISLRSGRASFPFLVERERRASFPYPWTPHTSSAATGDSKACPYKKICDARRLRISIGRISEGRGRGTASRRSAPQHARGRRTHDCQGRDHGHFAACPESATGCFGSCADDFDGHGGEGREVEGHDRSREREDRVGRSPAAHAVGEE